MLRTYPVPIVQQVETKLPPTVLFEAFRGGAMPFFLDSGMDTPRLGRYSMMGSNPFLVLKSRGDNITLRRGTAETTAKGNPIKALDELLATYRLDGSNTPVPFTGGAVGYLSYDLRHFIERLPARAADDLNLPECYFGFYDIVLVFDNLLGQTFLVSTGFPELEEQARINRAQERLEALKEKLAGVGSALLPDARRTKGILSKDLKGNFSHRAYIEAVKKARQYIIDGDIFEVNLSQRFETPLPFSPYELYRRLRQINPAPFASYLDFGEVTIVGASPERFLKVQGGEVETRPIKGTRRRGLTPEEDKTIAGELLNSIKDRAENMMIVDLERNDLGRICTYGSIKVTELAILEEFPTVFHLTSTIVGKLREGISLTSLINATFPGGSISGAPKIRAMEIIDELEPTRRSVYTGSLGYLSFNGNIDLNIVIRTFLVKEGKAYFQVGGAVVFDSNPELEYQETMDKARALIRALGLKAE